MNKGRTLVERRIFRARKINHRKEVAKSIWQLNWLLDRKSGRFADKLVYARSGVYCCEPSYSNRKRMDSLNYRMEDYCNESVR